MRKIVLMGMFCFVYSLMQAQFITRAEYFFDSDPGVGKASKTAITSPQDSINTNFNIPISFPGGGFHILGVRAQNANGTWSLTETRAIYALNNVVVILPGNVLSYEYFIDSDPGIGKGTKGSIADTSNISINVSMTGLAPGFHISGLRLLDSNHLWSETESRIFYILPDVSVLPNTKIEAMEYFIDTDPGIGKAVNIPGVSSNDSVVLDISPSIAGLTPGFHTLLMRAKNSSGNWGMQDARVFYIDTSYQFKSGPIVEAEYYLDTDPGLGKATQISPLTIGDSISENFNVSILSLAIGNHDIVVRVKDSTGTWSLPEIKNFTIKDSTGADGISNVSDDHTLLLYPNPASDLISIKFNLNAPSNVNVEVFDYTGRKMLETLNENLIEGSNLISLNVSGLNPGIYILHFHSLNRSESFYFIKQ